MAPSSLSSQEIMELLARSGRFPTETKKHVIRFENKDPITSFYLKTPVGMRTAPLVVHPDWEIKLRSGLIPGIEIEGLYKNSNMLRFPRPADRSSQTGIGVSVRTAAALKSLLSLISGSTANTQPLSAIADIEDAATTLAGVSQTERQQLIDARMGQGRFRAEVAALWGGCCAVTGMSVSKILRASHIKPWRTADNAERLDPHNGLLLAAGIDSAFDAGLVTFTDSGTILLSSEINVADLATVGVFPTQKLGKPPSARMIQYLSYHRLHIFGGAPGSVPG